MCLSLHFSSVGMFTTAFTNWERRYIENSTSMQPQHLVSWTGKMSAQVF